MKRAFDNNLGFTLLELLIVVAVIGLLVGILLPGLSQARAAAQRTVCVHNLNQIGLGTVYYVHENNYYPPIWQNRSTGTVRWMDLIKPYIDKTSEVFLCPSDPQKIVCEYDPEIHLSYGINTYNLSGNNAYCFWYGVRWDLVQRPSNVILFADCTPGKSYCGSGSTFSEPVPYVDYRHVNKSFGAVFCDGHAEWKTRTISLDWDASR